MLSEPIRTLLAATCPRTATITSPIHSSCCRSTQWTCSSPQRRLWRPTGSN